MKISVNTPRICIYAKKNIKEKLFEIYLDYNAPFDQSKCLIFTLSSRVFLNTK